MPVRNDEAQTRAGIADPGYSGITSSTPWPKSPMSPNPPPAGRPFNHSNATGAGTEVEKAGRSSRFSEPAALRARSGSIWSRYALSWSARKLFCMARILICDCSAEV